MVYDRQAREGGPRSESIRAVAPQLGVGPETLRIWCNRHGPTEPVGPGEPLEEENLVSGDSSPSPAAPTRF